MTLVIPGLLTPPEAAAIRAAAERLDFADGRETAGRFARTVKANHQARPSPELEAIQAKVGAALRTNPVFASAARPRALTPLILSRYRTGETYGLHVDDAMLGGIRRQLSFTLLLYETET